MTATNNVRVFEESSLTNEQYNRALGYVCYERNYYYLFSRYYDLTTYPLLYLDRFIGWQYSNGREPLLNLHNGFTDLLDEHLRYEELFLVATFKDTLKSLFADGRKMLVNFWTTNAMGTTFVTSLMLEGIDESGDSVYFTKINEDMNVICQSIAYDELLTKIDKEDPNTVELTVIRDASVIRELSQLSPLQAFRHIFSNLYGYSLRADGLYKHDQLVQLKTDGVSELVQYFRGAMHDLVTDGEISKPNQFKLNKHIHNRFQPIQYYLEYVLATDELVAVLSEDLKQTLVEGKDQMNVALKTMLKFASLFVMRPTEANYNLYLKALSDIQTILPNYQSMQLELLKQLLAQDVAAKGILLEWVDKLFVNLLPEASLRRIHADFDAVKDTPLTQLGLESLSVMGLVLNIEQEYGIEIDYATFDLADIETLAMIQKFLGLQ